MAATTTTRANKTATKKVGRYAGLTGKRAALAKGVADDAWENLDIPESVTLSRRQCIRLKNLISGIKDVNLRRGFMSLFTRWTSNYAS